MIRLQGNERGWAVEVEALGQSVVTGPVRAALVELLPEPLEADRKREQAGREDAKGFLATWRAA